PCAFTTEKRDVIALEPETRCPISLFVLFVVSAVTLGLEILLTRVFSVVLFASHSFLAISLALFGTGSGALLVYFARPLAPDALRRRQILLLSAFSLAVVLSLWVLLQIEFVPQRIEDPATRMVRENLSYVERSALLQRNPELFQSWKLFGAVPVAFLPFFLAGYLQALIFRSAPGNFGRMYGIDLIGATFGSLTIPFLLVPLGLKGTVCAMAALASAPASFALATGEKRLWEGSAAAAPLLVAAILSAAGSFQVRYAAGFAEKDLIREHWSPMARVALMNYRGQEMYVIDNSSRSYYAPRNASTVRRYMRALYTIPFQLKEGGDLLVIASGGGQELTMASHFGMKRIDAVEIARPMVLDILQNRSGEPGNPYLLPNVHTHIADGRSVIMRSRHRYDVIEMLDVNFATVAGQISLAWSPNFISTQEAFSEYLEHLKEDGLLCYTLFSYGRSPLAGEKVRRLVSLVAGMKAAGVDRPEKQLLILSRPLPYGHQTMFMAKKTPYTKDELARIAAVAESRGAKIEVFFPDLKEAGI
ncbi:MAG TPA: hypothetical protein VLS90_14975, partial [Thermodesulfobacteriota bacterium]|nr:hypothetical protein [Thermodesulfobacteriota bacterium]